MTEQLKAEAAVAEDWEAKFEKQFVESDEDGDRIYEPGDVNSIKTFITNLLAAKDRETGEIVLRLIQLLKK